jgi:hypothetical protein
VARKTSRLLEQLHTGDWKPSSKTDADEQCEFRYQPEGWGQAYRFVGLRYKKKEEKSQTSRCYTASPTFFRASEHTNRKSHPFQAWLAQTEKI